MAAIPASIVPLSTTLRLPPVVVPILSKIAQVPHWVVPPTPGFGFHVVKNRGPDKGKHVDILQFLPDVNIIIFGRDPAGAHVFIGHPSIDCQHALVGFHKASATCFIQDLETANGTMVNGCAIDHDPFELPLGARIRFGEAPVDYIFNPLTDTPSNLMPTYSQPSMAAQSETSAPPQSPGSLPPVPRAVPRSPKATISTHPDDRRRMPSPPRFDHQSRRPPDFRPSPERPHPMHTPSRRMSPPDRFRGRPPSPLMGRRGSFERDHMHHSPPHARSPPERSPFPMDDRNHRRRSLPYDRSHSPPPPGFHHGGRPPPPDFERPHGGHPDDFHPRRRHSGGSWDGSWDSPRGGSRGGPRDNFRGGNEGHSPGGRFDADRPGRGSGDRGRRFGGRRGHGEFHGPPGPRNDDDHQSPGGQPTGLRFNRDEIQGNRGGRARRPGGNRRSKGPLSF